MVKISFLQGLSTVLLSLFSTTFGVEDEVNIPDIFTVQPGNNNGGCDSRMDLLNQWHAESIESLVVAISAIENLGWLYDERVRESLNKFFGFDRYTELEQAIDGALEIEQEMQYVLDFLNKDEDTDEESEGGPKYKPDRFWLFCNSDFLTEQQRSDTAQDKHGKDLLDKDGNPVPIEGIPNYLKLLKEHPGTKPWWAGDNTASLNGYFFDVKGRTYCNQDENLGVTAGINIVDETTETGFDQLAAIILCPKAFDGVTGRKPAVPNSYLEANNLLKDGSNLADAVPKSASLIHELFHALRGDMFLSGNAEKYLIAEVINLANGEPEEAEKNPESYVFFIAHMYHLFGKPASNEPWSIPKNWDFRSIDGGSTNNDKKDMVFGAKVPGPKDVDPLD